MCAETNFSHPIPDNIVIMEPAAYDWMPGDAPGVYTKWLGTFTERNTSLGFIRLDAGATFSAGMHPSIELLFLSKGSVRLQGKEYGERAAFEFAKNQGPVPVQAVQPSEFFCIVLPQF
jgi:hypothetical protein